MAAPGCSAASLASVFLILLGFAARQARRSWIRIRDFLDDWGGAPGRPGVPERAGVMKRLANVEGDVQRITAETRPNGGHSLRDRVDRAVTDVAEVKDRVTKLTGRVELFEERRKNRQTGDGG